MLRIATSALTIAATIAILGGSALGMSIRDDRDQSLYEDQLNTVPFDATGRFIGAPLTGTVFSTPHGSATVTERLNYPHDPSLSTAVDGADFALFKLSSSLPGSNARLYLGDTVSLAGQTAVYTGGGKTGDGDTGANGPRKLLAGTNVIDGLGVDFGDGIVTNIAASDFDDPGPQGKNGTNLEMGLSDGDSGGGLWVDLGEGYKLAGVHSAVSDPDEDDVLGEYGQRNYSTVFTPMVLLWIADQITVPGDVDLNSVVDAADIDDFVRALQGTLTEPEARFAADVDGNGVVDSADIDDFISALQTGGSEPIDDDALAILSSQSNPSIPEPGTIALLGAAGLLMLRRRR